MSADVYDLIIIGADSAGLSAGIYAGRKKMKALILSKKFGGQSLYASNVENYPGFESISGANLMVKFRKQVEKYGTTIKDTEEVLEVGSLPADKAGSTSFIVTTKENKYESKTVIIATGASWKKLNIPGEEKFIGKGVSFCAICDAPFYSGKDVVVVGGGNSAFDSAYDLLDFASKIYVLQHSEKFTGDSSMFEKLKKTGKVEFFINTETKEIKGDKFVEGLVYEDTKTGETKEIKTSGVFINIGQIPNSSLVENLVELNKYKQIKIDHKTNTTSVEGIFAAGDVSDILFRQVVLAAASGVNACLSAYKYLSEK